MLNFGPTSKSTQIACGVSRTRRYSLALVFMIALSKILLFGLVSSVSAQSYSNLPRFQSLVEEIEELVALGQHDPKEAGEIAQLLKGPMENRLASAIQYASELREQAKQWEALAKDASDNAKLNKERADKSREMAEDPLFSPKIREKFLEIARWEDSWAAESEKAAEERRLKAQAAHQEAAEISNEINLYRELTAQLAPIIPQSAINEALWEGDWETDCGDTCTVERTTKRRFRLSRNADGTIGGPYYWGDNDARRGTLSNGSLSEDGRTLRMSFHNEDNASGTMTLRLAPGNMRFSGSWETTSGPGEGTSKGTMAGSRVADVDCCSGEP